MDSLPLAKTLAFGPVPEGSIKAQEAAIVAGTPKGCSGHCLKLGIPPKGGKGPRRGAAYIQRDGKTAATAWRWRGALSLGRKGPTTLHFQNQ